MVVNDLYELCQTTLKIMSGYNGKILCKSFDPKKHINVGEREVIAIWAGFEETKMTGFRTYVCPIVCAYVDGYSERIKEEVE